LKDDGAALVAAAGALVVESGCPGIPSEVHSGFTNVANRKPYDLYIRTTDQPSAP
jgi:hypothetical protein